MRILNRFNEMFSVFICGVILMSSHIPRLALSVKTSHKVCLCHTMCPLWSGMLFVLVRWIGDLRQVQVSGCTIGFAPDGKVFCPFPWFHRKASGDFLFPSALALSGSERYRNTTRTVPKPSLYPWHLGNVTNRWFHLVCAVVLPSASPKQALALHAQLFL